MARGIATENFDKVEIDSTEALWTWLGAHHAQPDSIWLVTWKADCTSKYVSREEVLDALVAHGWIDGIRRKLDDKRTMQLISPRKTQYWAKSYKDRADRLIAEGLMHPSGQRSIDNGRASGLWSFMDDVDALILPDDLIQALSALPPADTHFAGFAASKRRNILRWIKLAKTPATRASRIAQAATLAQENKTPPQM
ncbi:MAG: YdeI/OmpD-associated family protein [Pseudomonadota bacterium]